MKFEFDTLKFATLIREAGLNNEATIKFVNSLIEVDIKNIYSVTEVNTMLSETIEKVFRDHRIEFEKANEKFEKRLEIDERANKERMETERRALDKRMELAEKRLDAEIAEARLEARSQRRWMVGTIITVGLGLAGYISALFHFTH